MHIFFFQSLHICPKCANVWFELQRRVFVVGRLATRRWNRLGPYFWLMSTPKYVHTSGTSYAHIRHTTLKKYDFLMIFVIYVSCAWCVQILPMFSQHLKLFRVDLKLSNEHHRSFVAHKLVPVAPIEFWWKFWKIDFWMKNLISDRKSDFLIRSWIEPQERLFVVERRATRRWKALGPYFWVIAPQVCAHIKHIQSQEFYVFFVKLVEFCHICFMCLICAHNVFGGAHNSKVWT